MFRKSALLCSANCQQPCSASREQTIKMSGVGAFAYVLKLQAMQTFDMTECGCLLAVHAGLRTLRWHKHCQNGMCSQSLSGASAHAMPQIGLCSDISKVKHTPDPCESHHRHRPRHDQLIFTCITHFSQHQMQFIPGLCDLHRPH